MTQAKTRNLLVTLLLVAAPATWAASLTVNTVNDELNSDGDCSLREAVRSANSDTAVDACTAGAGADTINLPEGIYTLSLSGAEANDASERDLDITDDLQIVSSAGTARETVITAADGYSGRAFQVRGTDVTAVFRDITVDGFDSGGGTPGAAFHIAGQTLELYGVLLRGNTANAGGAVGFSGAAKLTVANTTFAANRSTNANFGGGAIGTGFTQLTVRDSTFLRNHAAGRGGAIYGAYSGAVTLDNVTLVNNSAAGEGGGLYLDGPTLAMRNTVLAGNRTNSTGPDCSLKNSSISANTDYNFFGTTDGCGVTPAANSLSGQHHALAPPGRYDGDIPLRPPHSYSPLIDAGSCTNASGSSIATTPDQRNAGQIRNVDGDGDGIADCDIGAVERQEVAFAVDTAADTRDVAPGDGACADADGRCSLRAALDEANANPGLDEIALPGETITLTRTTTGDDANADGDLDVRDSVILRGTGASATVLDAGGIDRVLHVPNIGNSPRTVALSGLTLRNGDSGAPAGASTNEAGGGIYVSGSVAESNQLVADGIRVSGNRATGVSSDGGGIAVDFSEARVLRSTIDGNEADRSGSGLSFSGGSEGWLRDVTIIGNAAGNSGAVGAFGGSQVHLESSTVADNTAVQGNAFSGNGQVTVHASIVTSDAADNCDFFSSGGITSLGKNLEDGTDCGFTAVGDQQNAAAGLAAASNAGSIVPLREPARSSDALDAGSCVTATGFILPRAPLGSTRPQDATGDGVYQCDVGAAERQALRLSLGPNTPRARSVPAGSAEVVIAQYRLANESGEALSLGRVTFAASGSGDDAADVTGVSLIEDADRDGEVDGSEAVLVSGAGYSADNGTITFDLSTAGIAIPAGGSTDLLVVYSFNSSLARSADRPLQGLGLFATGGVLLLMVAPLARTRHRLVLALLPAIALLASCGGGGGGSSSSDAGGQGSSVSQTYSASVEEMTVTGSNGGDLHIRVTPTPSNALTVTE